MGEQIKRTMSDPEAEGVAVALPPGLADLAPDPSVDGWNSIEGAPVIYCGMAADLVHHGHVNIIAHARGVRFV